MTREEAIKILDKYDLNFCDIDGNPIPPQDLAEAFDMAIEALEQQTAKCDNCKYSEETDGMNCYECLKGMSDNFEALEQELCDDCISRKETIRWVKTECNPYGKPTLDFESGKKVIEHLEQMPSAEVGTQMSLADRPTGHWIDKGDFYVCSECGKRMPYAVLNSERSIAYAFMSDYCPHCGSAMEVESDEE